MADLRIKSDLLQRFHKIPDDGHTIKVVRALGICQELSAKYGDQPWIKIKNDDEWLTLHYSVLDGTEHSGVKWVRTTGLEEAWKVGDARGKLIDHVADIFLGCAIP